MYTGDVQRSSLAYTRSLDEFGLLASNIDWFIDTDCFTIVLGGFYRIEETLCKDCG